MPETDLHAVAFPKLSAEQVEALGHCPFTKLHPFRAGDQLFASCERDPRYGSKFRLTDHEKFNMYVRWELIQERLLGNDEKVRRLVERV